MCHCAFHAVLPKPTIPFYCSRTKQYTYAQDELTCLKGARLALGFLSSFSSTPRTHASRKWLWACGMPTDLLPLRVEHFLLRACPSAALATHDIVAEATRRNLRDEDVISQLTREYNADRLGFPVGAMPHDGTPSLSSPLSPTSTRGAAGDAGIVAGGADGISAAVARRRRMLINYYVVNRILPIDLKRIDVLCDDHSVSDGVLLAGLKGKYGLTEVGYPYPKADAGAGGEVDPLTGGPQPPTLASAKALADRAEAMALQYEVEMLFARAAPERLQEAKGIYESFARLGGAATRDDVLASVRRSLGSCASDGWPLDADKRRLSRLQRFFLNNDSSRLFDHHEALAALVNSDATEHSLFLGLRYAYGKDELGFEVPVDHHLREEVTLLLSRCRPVSATDDFVLSYLALGERRGWDGERLLRFLQGLFDCGPDGWPLEVRQRIRSKTIRYLMMNAPEDVASVDAVLAEIVGGSSAGAPAPLGGWRGEGLNEGTVMTRLYERYGRNEEGRPVLNTPAARFRVCEFLEQYVPEAEVERLADAAMRLNMYPDTLMAHLRQQYASFAPYPYAIREQLRVMYSRAAPEKAHQIDQLLRVKRLERIPDGSIMKAVMRRLGCGPDGWPADPVARRRQRLQRFLERNDPQRLVQMELLMAKDPRTDDQLMADLAQQYGVPEEGGGGVPRLFPTEAIAGSSHGAPAEWVNVSAESVVGRSDVLGPSAATASHFDMSPIPSSSPRPGGSAEVNASLTMRGAPRRVLGGAAAPHRSPEGDAFEGNSHKYQWLLAGQ